MPKNDTEINKSSSIIRVESTYDNYRMLHVFGVFRSDPRSEYESLLNSQFNMKGENKTKTIRNSLFTMDSAKNTIQI